MKNKTKTLSILSLFSFGLMIVACDSAQEPEVVNDEPVVEEPTVEAPKSARPAEWGYVGEDGPAAWGSLDPVYSLCGTGHSQSPINLVNSEGANDVSLDVNYGSTSLNMTFNEHVHDIVDNGHTIQMDVEPGSTFKINNKVYELKQFHFHTPSEHTVDGKHFPLEVHFVHQSEDGALAVLSALFKEGKENVNFKPIIANLPTEKGQTIQLEDVISDLNLHVPANSSAFTYTGSLTTPPCSEDVQWVVLKDHPTMSAAQIGAISAIIGANNRPVQGLYERTIGSSHVGETSAK